MKDKNTRNNKIIYFISLLAIGFGLLTVMSGGFALFGGAAGKQFAGKYVSFVLWFNFSAGFVYILSGLGVFLKKEWGVVTAKILAVITVLVFIAFAGLVLSGAEYELRTLAAMTFRSVFWIVVYLSTKKLLNHKKIKAN